VSAGTELTLRTGHTAALDPGTLEAIRTLADDVFGDIFTAHDWEHALGGVHALVWFGETLVGHGSVVQRRLMHGGRALRCGYVEAVAVRSEYRRRGCGAAVMDVLERVIRSAYELGALSATPMAEDFYAARGWLRWRGALSSLTPSGVASTSPGEAIHVLETDVPLDLDGELTCDWRDGDVW
jgi:aminoglycoside 2'-N-acetyltransferase I